MALSERILARSLMEKKLFLPSGGARGETRGKEN